LRRRRKCPRSPRLRRCSARSNPRLLKRSHLTEGQIPRLDPGRLRHPSHESL
jgi:hypothetical protein